VEGLHLDPGHFIADLARQGLVMLPARPPHSPRGQSPPAVRWGGGLPLLPMPLLRAPAACLA
jgi:hypothetical protein